MSGAEQSPMTGAVVGRPRKPQSPTFQRRLIRAAERAGLRQLLATMGTRAARRATGADVELFFDEIWIRRVGDRYYGDKAAFDYYAGEFAGWNMQHDLWANIPVDCWFHGYSPRAGDVVIDVGAGFGNDAIAFSRAVGPTGRVIAVEAHPVSFRKLEKTCKWSKLANVVPLNVAVSDAEGVVRITGEDDDELNAIGGFSQTQAGGFDARARPFDDIAEELKLGPIALVKMNIEGAERAALSGMPKTLARTARVAIACHDFRTVLLGESEFFRTRDFVRATLEGAGFRVKAREDKRPYVADTLYGVRD